MRRAHMISLVHSSAAAQLWEIWLRRRASIGSLVGVAVATSLLNTLVFTRILESDSNAIPSLNFLLTILAAILTLMICGYTELNPGTGTIGFPQRLFTLPVSSLQLVAVPIGFTLLLV